MKKNDIVKIKPARSDWDVVGPSLIRSTTAEEVEEWYTSPESKGMDSAGESKLPPCIAYIDISLDDFMIVVRARCAPQLGYHKRSKMTKVQVISGQSIGCIGYVPRRQLQVTTWEEKK